MALIVAGIGARPACNPQELLALLARASSLAGCTPTLLAAPWFRADLPGLTTLGLPVEIVSEAALLSVQPRCQTRSARALAETGIGSVAEGCALAACGEHGQLLLARIASANATCAIAVGERPQ